MAPTGQTTSTRVPRLSLTPDSVTPPLCTIMKGGRVGVRGRSKRVTDPGLLSFDHNMDPLSYDFPLHGVLTVFSLP